MTKPKIWLNGMTCMLCLKGTYPGYEAAKKLTRPCTHCGFQQQASVSSKELAEQRRIIAFIKTRTETTNE
jgi:hypothetical protein